MRWLAGLCLVISSVISCAGADLEHRIDALVNNGAFPGTGSIGIQVVELATGQTIYRHNDDHLFLPASNMKLLTAALALQRLGPDYRFTTRVVLEPSGDLVLAGSGDPSFSSRKYPYEKGDHASGSLKAIEELADQVVARGIRRIDGDVVGDDQLYPWEPSPPSWTADDLANNYGARVSALTFNDNVVAVKVLPGARRNAATSLSASFEYLTLENKITTGAANTESSIQAHSIPGSNQWVLTGSVPAGSAMASIEIPVQDPAAYAAAALYDALTQRGVRIRGRPIARHRGIDTVPSPSVAGQEIASRQSPPLRELLETMLKVSQNLHAELLLREAGRVTQRDGTNDAGIAALTAFLKERGGDSAEPAREWRADDGSGLSRNDLLSPRLITRILAQQYKEYGERWTALLPAGGAEGTLEHRLCCLSNGSGIWAKTGTLNRALALSGYAQSAANGRLAFSILVNDFSAPTGEVQQWIDRIAKELLE